MKIHHVAITVSNLERSRAFYESFGFETERSFERRDLKGKAVFLKLYDFRVEIWEFEDKKKGNNVSDLDILGIRHIAFEVPEIEESIRNLSEKGLVFCPITTGASGARFTFTSDPDGNQIEFYEPRN